MQIYGIEKSVYFMICTESINVAKRDRPVPALRFHAFFNVHFQLTLVVFGVRQSCACFRRYRMVASFSLFTQSLLSNGSSSPKNSIH